MVVEGEFACVMINDAYENGALSERDFVHLKMLKNVFCNNLCAPIVERHPVTNFLGHPHLNRGTKWIYDKPEHYILQDNILEGFNGSAILKKKPNVRIDANAIYYDDQPESRGD
eukprot:CAMPEP_0202698838 /NCGR_PEP_ID=MMETSP1385-20130828/12083_1 /ASSEMBLY_ACC=CAM_ASM_000861 /TAXON_ID=933848 /ORGANISM="Elphidium margaritaceum" /LENGTH=113 /DNA_ID=CAMNT_0049355649 /DNA_START=9 /DNA_END=350 /DNA_ORIENTATION=-